MARTLPARPADPREISFDRSCFRVVGHQLEYSVSRAYGRGPLRTTDQSVADAYALKTNRTVTVHRVEILERISWR